MFTITVDGALFARTNSPEQAIDWVQELGATRATAWLMVSQSIRVGEVINTIKGQVVGVRHA